MDPQISRSFDSLEHSFHQLRAKLAKYEQRLAAVEQRLVDLSLEVDQLDKQQRTKVEKKKQ